MNKTIREPTRALDANIWEREANDWYREQRWCSVRLFDDYAFNGVIYDPSCGKRNIVQAALDHGYWAEGTDLVNRDGNTNEFDFFAMKTPIDNIVSNPPFEDIERYTLHALALARYRVALIFPARRMAAAGGWLERTPLKYQIYMTPRPSIPPGQVYEELEAQGKEPSGGQQDFVWLLWDHAHRGDPVTKWLHRDQQPRAKDQRL